MYIERVLEEIKRLGFPNPGKFVPCTQEEVKELEEKIHLSLPLTYHEWLQTMGSVSAHQQSTTRQAVLDLLRKGGS